MMRKTFISLFVVLGILGAGSLIVLVRRGALLTHKSGVTFSRDQISEAVEKAGGAPTLANEAAETIHRFGTSDVISGYRLTNSPMTARLASLLSGEIIGLSPADPGVPAHITIRRGSHFDYQFIYIFPPGSTPTVNGLIPINGSVYLRNTAP